MTALLAAAKAARADLLRQWGYHVKLCGECTSLKGSNLRFCDDGWDIAKRLQAAKSRVAELQESALEGQVTLF